MRLQKVHQGARIHPLELVVGALLAFQTHPDPADAQPHQLIDGIGLQNPSGAEDVDGPAFVYSSISSRSLSARFLWRRKFSSRVKKDFTLSFSSISHMTWKSSSPVS